MRRVTTSFDFAAVPEDPKKNSSVSYCAIKYFFQEKGVCLMYRRTQSATASALQRNINVRFHTFPHMSPARFLRINVTLHMAEFCRHWLPLHTAHTAHACYYHRSHAMLPDLCVSSHKVVTAEIQFVFLSPNGPGTRTTFLKGLDRPALESGPLQLNLENG